jgi:hypothetical protein
MRHQNVALLLLLLLLLPLSCQPGRDPAGKYRATDPSNGGKAIQLELKSDGKGSWKMGPDEVSFTWEDRGAEVWLHLKVGGVIRGRIGTDGSISISLPDAGNFRFQRVAS